MGYSSITYLDFSNIYIEESKQVKGSKRIDLSDVSSTNCYCDDGAAEEIRRRLSGEAPSGIHFMDSGNHHYATLFYLEKIKSDFGLVLIDNHPDIQPPAFGDILSCGGWVHDAIRDLPQLRKVYMIGMSPEHLLEVSPLPEIVTVVSGAEEIENEGGLPLYISLDKDVLTPDYAACDWDQGKMELAELLKLLKKLRLSCEIAGVDICGEKKNEASAADIALNMETNRILLNLLLQT